MNLGKWNYESLIYQGSCMSRKLGKLEGSKSGKSFLVKVKKRREEGPGWTELENRRALDGQILRRVLRKGGPRLEWKERRKD
ncbi:hypothetical protein TNCV_2898331 [Trichonephila clavipes]|nr:hypothetical protein TNCV_2898331 [Trichonephila clavipes]